MGVDEVEASARPARRPAASMSAFMCSIHATNASRSRGLRGSRTRCTWTPWQLLLGGHRVAAAREHVHLDVLLHELLGQLAHVPREPALDDRRVLPGEDEDAGGGHRGAGSAAKATGRSLVRAGAGDSPIAELASADQLGCAPLDDGEDDVEHWIVPAVVGERCAHLARRIRRLARHRQQPSAHGRAAEARRRRRGGRGGAGARSRAGARRRCPSPPCARGLGRRRCSARRRRARARCAQASAAARSSCRARRGCRRGS